MNGVTIDLLAWAAGGLLLFGYGLMGILWLSPTSRDTKLAITISLVSTTLVIALLVGAFLLGGPFLIGFFALLALRVGYEAARVAAPSRPAFIFAVTSLACTLGAMWLPPLGLSIAGIWTLILARKLMTTGRKAQKATWSTQLINLLFYPILPLALLAGASMDPATRPLMLLAFMLTETFDSYALLAGKLVGRTKAFPTLSPGKTVEGLVGGVICLALTAAAVAGFIDAPIIWGIMIALFVGALGVSGDLAGSHLKRKGGVKDYPVVLSSLGGALDITDAWIAGGAGLAAAQILINVQ